MQERRAFWKDPFAEPPAHFAPLYYERGRSEGAICQWDAAARDLNHAMELDQKSRGPVWMDLTEIARMYHAQGNNSLAEVYFDMLYKDMPEAQVARQDPEGFVADCEEAAEVFAALGKAEKSAQFRAKAAAVRANHPKLSLPKDWTPYGQVCGVK